MPGNKSLATAQPKKRRTEWEILAGMDALDYLAARFSQYRDSGDHPNAERIVLEAMPYLKPKLRSIDHKVSGSVSVSVRIGGDASDGGHAVETEDDD